jgi:hypothetical protein
MSKNISGEAGPLADVVKDLKVKFEQVDEDGSSIDTIFDD